MERASTLNQQCIGRVIYKLEEVFFSDELPDSSEKGMIGVNFPGNTEVIALDSNGQSSSGRLVWKSTKTTHYKADESDEDIKLRPSKRKKPSSRT